MSYVDLPAHDPLLLTPDDHASLEKLVDHSEIEKALERHRASVVRRDAVKDEYDAAKKAASDATDAYEKSLSGEIDTPIMDAYRTMEDAVKKRDVTGEVLNRASQAMDKADQGTRHGRGKAWRPVYVEGINRRLSAAKKADDARAMLKEAERDYAQATRVVLAAHNNGTDHPIPQQLNLALGDVTEIRERVLWSNAAESWVPAMFTKEAE